MGALADPRCHLQQNSMDLNEFIFQQAHQFIVLLNSFKRFYKHGLAAGTCAVYDSRYVALVLGLYRNDEAFAANGDDVFLQRVAFRQPPQETLQ